MEDRLPTHAQEVSPGAELMAAFMLMAFSVSSRILFGTRITQKEPESLCLSLAMDEGKAG